MHKHEASGTKQGRLFCFGRISESQLAGSVTKHLVGKITMRIYIEEKIQQLKNTVCSSATDASGNTLRVRMCESGLVIAVITHVLTLKKTQQQSTDVYEVQLVPQRSFLRVFAVEGF